VLRAITIDKRVGAIAGCILLSGALIPWMAYMVDSSVVCSSYMNCPANIQSTPLMNGALWQYLLLMRHSESPDARKVILASCLPLLTGAGAVLMNLGFWGRRLKLVPLVAYLSAIILDGLIVAYEWLMWLARGIDQRYGNQLTVGLSLVITSLAFIAIARNYAYLKQEYAVMVR
jgi:hypothetical protein